MAKPATDNKAAPRGAIPVQIPQYECHKLVGALQVLEVTRAGALVSISFAEEGIEPKHPSNPIAKL